MKKPVLPDRVCASLFALSLLLSGTTFAQNQSHPIFTSAGAVQSLAKSAGVPQIQVREGLLFHLDTAVYGAASRDLMPGTTIVLPLPEGGFATFSVTANTVMSSVLDQTFPEIMAANIADVTNRNRWGKIDLTPRGLHVMIFDPGNSTIFIDPVYSDDNSLHVVYRKSDFETDKEMDCRIQEMPGRPASSTHGLAKSGEPYNSCELRTYRLALAATGEYTIFHGGTVGDAMAAIVTTMNRVNGIYERDFGVTMTLIEGNENLVFEDPSTDPFSNGNAVAMLQENQTLMNAEVGANNYDIGHVFGTNSGGVAGLGVTCNDNLKARGVTGSAAPIGDPFDVDYVAHEIGHQFGANHSFNNSCNGNRNNSTAAEPGSGSTIMAYAGICNPNVQNNSDDHFHAVSMSEIGQFISQVQCAVASQVDNTMPLIGDVSASIFVPVLTPFVLDADVVDLEGDELTYTWEQMDVEISTQPPLADATEGPNFRSFGPDTASARYFPRLNALATNTVGNWERLPGVDRSMNFRLSVRDNNPLAGCTQYTEVEVNFVDADGPFELLYPNAPAITWQGLSYETVTWNVAGTDEAPFNAEEIDLYLSTSALPQFNMLIAEAVPNTGSYTLQVPNISTTTARIMAKASDGHFFDISGWNFTIAALEQGFAFESSATGGQGCQGDAFEFDLSTLMVGESVGPAVALEIISQPAGTEVALSANSIQEDETITLSAATTTSTPPGQGQIVVQGTTGAFVNTITFVIDLTELNPEPPLLQAPFNGEMAVSVNPTLQWTPEGISDFTYEVEVALDPQFSEIVVALAGLDETSAGLTDLVPETTYFWRVRSFTSCGASPFSVTNAFTTFACISETTTDLDVQIEEGQGGSNISVGAPDLVAAISVNHIKGSYSNPGQLYFSLIGPDGTEVNLGGIGCGIDLHITGNNSVEVTDADGGVTTLVSSATAGFGPGVGSNGLSGGAALAFDASADANALCEDAINPQVLNGKIAVLYRGGCTFVEKVLNAQAAGAIAVVVINNQGDNVIAMGGNSNQITIPSVMIGLTDGIGLVDQINDLPEEFDVSFDDLSDASESPCQTDAVTLPPAGQLSNFVGSFADGVWQLTATDATSGGVGVIGEWTLEICLDQALLSVNEMVESPVEVFPNPTQGEVNLRWRNPSDYDHLYMTDLTGRLVYRSTVTGADAAIVRMNHLSAGLYVVVLSGTADTFHTKVILSH